MRCGIAEVPMTTMREQLARRKVEVRAPRSLNDDEITSELRRLVEGLASIRVFLHNTDHLSDRELYGWLWDELDELTEDVALNPNMGVHLDILGKCEPQDLEVYLKFYADETYRRMWAEDFPDDVIPLHEDPKYPRALPEAFSW